MSVALPAPGADGLFRWEFLTGAIEIGHPTGRIVTDADGWNHQEYTDTITRDRFGAEVSRKPTPVITRWKGEPEAAPSIGSRLLAGCRNGQQAN